MYHCPKCKKPIQPFWKHCPNCGIYFMDIHKNILKKRKERIKFQKFEFIVALVGIFFQVIFVISVCLDGLCLITISYIGIALSLDLLGFFYLRKSISIFLGNYTFKKLKNRTK